MGAFLARNALLFVLAFELVLIPTTLLLAIWGGERRAGAAVRFLLYGAVSGLSLLGGVLAFGWFGQGAAGADTAVSFSFEAPDSAVRGHENVPFSSLLHSNQRPVPSQ
jgi:NADH:ubiquinone oxidoreductase subunit 4 (subunit M)